ncbi:MAG: hypothetical protein WCK51_13410 [Armatimonadota bacterium]
MAEGSKKTKKKGLMIVIILVVVLVLAAVAVVVLAKLGKINIPGLTPKKPAAASAKKPEVKPKAAPKKKVEEPKAPIIAEAPLNDKEGAIKLATVWNEIPTEGLVKITKAMTPTELAPVLVEMDAEKSAALLAAMDAKTATVVSRELKRVASAVQRAE